MYEGKSHTLFAKYAVPQMIGLLFNSVYMIVDGVFIGNRLGRDAMAAAAVSALGLTGCRFCSACRDTNCIVYGSCHRRGRFDFLTSRSR